MKTSAVMMKRPLKAARDVRAPRLDQPVGGDIDAATFLGAAKAAALEAGRVLE